MKRQVVKFVRPVYQAFVRAPGIKQILHHEAGKWEGYYFNEFIEGNYGKVYGVTKQDRIELIRCFQRNASEIQSGTSALVHTVLAREILSLPPEIQGDVIECGVWKGASCASLSLVCRLVGCRLIVADSFQGLPDDQQQLHRAPHIGVYGYYREGMFCGGIEEVKESIKKFGDLAVCDFLPGLFSTSLRQLPRALRFAFLDVDLVSSMQDCLRCIWPLLVEGGVVYTDDAGDMDVVRVFFDEGWWRANCNCAAPGFIGSGCGLPLGPHYSSIGYTCKPKQFDPGKWKKASHLYYLK
jgi:Macrocin-O-methyltransferase (TylF)